MAYDNRNVFSHGSEEKYRSPKSRYRRDHTPSGGSREQSGLCLLQLLVAMSFLFLWLHRYVSASVATLPPPLLSVFASVCLLQGPLALD